MDAGSRQRIEIGRERGDQRLALARAHFGDRALVQHHAADELDIEMALAEHATRRFAHRGKSRHQQIVELFARLQLGAEFFRLGAQFVIGQLLNFRLERVNRCDPRAIGLQPPII